VSAAVSCAIAKHQQRCWSFGFAASKWPRYLQLRERSQGGLIEYGLIAVGFAVAIITRSRASGPNSTPRFPRSQLN
jgi:hypothetical protein